MESDTVTLLKKQLGAKEELIISAGLLVSAFTVWHLALYSPITNKIDDISTLIQNDRAKLLSRPRITTLDNQPASISIGVTSWTRERTSSGTTGEVSITYKDQVTTKVGRFNDCIAIETMWYDPQNSRSQAVRKIVWYAADVGPVKVEHSCSVHTSG